MIQETIVRLHKLLVVMLEQDIMGEMQTFSGCLV